jgi:tetratricopeptide (TPR) repeat protein
LNHGALASYLRATLAQLGETGASPLASGTELLNPKTKPPVQQARKLPLRPAIVPVGEDISSPARLVSARSGVLPYVVRKELLAELQSWVQKADPFAVYLVGGAGGTGKTRLGVELCEHATRAGWLAGMLVAGSDQSALEALVDARTSRLIVVDYAETRTEQLELLLPLLAQGATHEHPARVLLLVRAKARGRDWGEVLPAKSLEMSALFARIGRCGLEDLPLTVDQRHTLFSAVAKTLADLPDPPLEVPGIPGVLKQEPFENPLLVVVAAYLAVHGQSKLPGTRDELIDELLGHEQRYWEASAPDHVKGNMVLQRRVIALATLAGAEAESEAVELLRLVPDLKEVPSDQRYRLACWVNALYPAGERFWNPLEPDLVGEHLIATTYTKEPEVLAGVLKRGSAQAVVRPLEVYARAALDHPGLAAALSSVLTDQLPALCKLAVAAAETETDLDLVLGDSTLAAALSRAITAIPVDPHILPAVEDLLPGRPDLILSPLALTVSRQLTTHLRPLAADKPATYEPDFAKSLNTLSVRLGEAGRRDEGLKAIEEAVSIYKRLATDKPAAYKPHLAGSLSNLSLDLGEAGRRDEGLKAIEEAVSIYKRLATDKPAAYKPYLAIALNNLSKCLWETGRHNEALKAIEEAISIYSSLATDKQATYEPGLARSLNNLSNCLRDTGRHKEALKAIEGAVSIRRRLAVDKPAAYKPDLARSLDNLSECLWEARRYEEALAASQEAISIYRRLATAEPAAYESDLAIMLHHRATHLTEAGCEKEAEIALDEAARLRR